MPVMKTVEKDGRKCPTHISSTEVNKMLLPVNDALEIISGKWKLQILVSLAFGRKRFKNMQNEVPGLTPKMLSKQLKELELNGLVDRKVYKTLPVVIEYEITPYGKTLKSVIKELHKWGSKHRTRMTAKNE
jgi:DNA-binding HxlR family transcriptional regulator